ncbi:MAG: DUF58 domain-containing protein [Woeseiaceae bacterium]
MSSIQWPFPKARFSAGLTAAANQRVLRWAKKRQGQDGPTTKLGPGRVYILPTGVGLIFALMSFAMLLGSMNYNNNLSFVLTFMLAALGLVSMHQCQRNLVGLELSFAGVEPVFAGQTAQFQVAVTNHSKSPRHGVMLYTDHSVSEVGDLPPGESRVFSIAVATDKRGWVELERFGIRTFFPFELFRSWAWLHMDLRGLVYPAVADEAPQPPPTQTAQGHRQHDARGEEDFAGLRRFHEGDSPRHVAWKAYARSNQLLSKQFSGADTSSQWFDFDSVPTADVEAKLSILTRWITDTDRTRADYGLRLPGHEFSPAHGDVQRQRCLEALALYGLEQTDG